MWAVVAFMTGVNTHWFYGGTVFAALFFLTGSIAMSTDKTADSIFEITGSYFGPGVECPQFQLDSGEMISLVNMPGEIEAGATVTLQGDWPMFSKCMQGRTFRVLSLKSEQE